MESHEEEYQCSDCGATVPADAKTCQKCGASLEETSEEDDVSKKFLSRLILLIFHQFFHYWMKRKLNILLMIMRWKTFGDQILFKFQDY